MTRGLSLGALALLVASPLLVSRIAGAGDPKEPPALGFAFQEVAREAGLRAVTTFGGRERNKYLLETTGTGVAWLDYDGDGWLDLLLVNGTTLEGFPKGEEPRSHLYRNRGDGTFEDRTPPAIRDTSGWGQAACVGDYDNDGRDDVYVTYYGQNRLYRNLGDGGFEDVTARAGLTSSKTRWGTGCAFLDYDRDGRLDLFAANYIDLDLKTAPVPESGLCRYKGVMVACGPPGLAGGKNVLYHNLGDGRFEDVSERSGILNAGTYGLGVSTLDFDDDGWTDLYVANDSNPAALYLNRHDGTFEDVGVLSGCAFSQDGKPQAGMGVAIGDYDHNGTLDIFKTNFAGDTSTLYSNAGGGLLRRPDLRERPGDQHPLAGLGHRLPGPRQRRVAGPVPHERPRLPRGRATRERGRLQAAQGGLPEPAQRPLRGHLRAPRAAGDDAEGGPRDRVRGLRQRRRRRRGGEQRPRHARPVPPGVPQHPPLAARQAGRDPVEPQRDRRACALRLRGHDARRRGEGRRQLHVPERPARALRPGRRRARGPARGALAERARRRPGQTSGRTRS